MRILYKCECGAEEFLQVTGVQEESDIPLPLCVKIRYPWQPKRKCGKLMSPTLMISDAGFEQLQGVQEFA